MARARLDTLHRLNEAGIATYVFVGPLLHDQLFAEIKKAGTSEIIVEFLNMPGHLRTQLNGYLTSEPTDIQEVHATSQDAEFRALLEKQIKAWVVTHELKMRFDQIVHHLGAQSLKEGCSVRLVNPP